MDDPPAWERTAVNLSRLGQRARQGDKAAAEAANRAWRRLKSESPDEAAAIARDLPDFQRRFQVSLYVPGEFGEGDA